MENQNNSSAGDLEKEDLAQRARGIQEHQNSNEETDDTGGDLAGNAVGNEPDSTDDWTGSSSGESTRGSGFTYDEEKGRTDESKSIDD